MDELMIIILKTNMESMLTDMKMKWLDNDFFISDFQKLVKHLSSCCIWSCFCLKICLLFVCLFRALRWKHCLGVGAGQLFLSLLVLIYTQYSVHIWYAYPPGQVLSDGIHVDHLAVLTHWPGWPCLRAPYSTKLCNYVICSLQIYLKCSFPTTIQSR